MFHSMKSQLSKDFSSSKSFVDKINFVLFDLVNFTNDSLIFLVNINLDEK